MIVEVKVVNFVTNPVNYKAVYVAILDGDQMMTPSCESSEIYIFEIAIRLKCEKITCGGDNVFGEKF